MEPDPGGLIDPPGIVSAALGIVAAPGRSPTRRRADESPSGSIRPPTQTARARSPRAATIPSGRTPRPRSLSTPWGPTPRRARRRVIGEDLKGMLDDLRSDRRDEG